MMISAPVPELEHSEDMIESVFFPSISLSDLRQVMRLDGTVTQERLLHAVDSAISMVNHNLQAWATTATDANGQKLTSLDDAQTRTYRRAVYAYAAANITERMASYDSTLEGRQRAEELNGYANQLMRDGHWAIRDLQGLPRTTVELI